MADDHRGEGDATEEGQSVFVVVGGDAAPLLKQTKAPFDGVAVSDLVGALGDGVLDLHPA